MNYFVKTPNYIQALFPKYIWKKTKGDKKIYLSFDDGPHPEHTVFVLNELKKYNAKATFFCIGKNVELYPEVYAQILAEGHAVGNHTHNHLNGRKVKDDEYLQNIKEANLHIKSNLFRPPYGSIRKSQAKLLRNNFPEMEIIMYSVLSADFDVNITKEKCWENVMQHCNDGSIVLFHDSEKAAIRMKYALPKFLESFCAKGYSFDAL